MEINFVGLFSALAVFLGIWWGHVGVRKIESISVRLWPPMLGAIILGVTCEIVAMRTNNITLSAACGILGMTLLWDAFEFYRQEQRIKKGHAPANPSNPRHVRILSAYPEATSFDWLNNRNPCGRAYNEDEKISMRREGE